jgi:hypothetical protein
MSLASSVPVAEDPPEVAIVAPESESLVKH